MSKVCEICSKGPATGNNVSHSHRKTKRRFLPNIQKKKIMVDGEEKQMKICTRCLKNRDKK